LPVRGLERGDRGGAAGGPLQPCLDLHLSQASLRSE
jgi:hypothetical protein